VVKIARDYEKAARSILDLIQEGNIGLMEAVKNFDPYRGVRLPSYAVWWIKAYIIRYVIANWRLVKIGTTQAQRKLFFNLKKERDRLEREGFFPTPKLIADKLNVKEGEVVEMEQRLGSSDLSVDAPLDAESDSNLLSVLPSEAQSAEDLLAKQEMQSLIKKGLDEFASTLNPKELIIFKERMLAEEKNTLHEVAGRLEVSAERVRQIENRLRTKLKEFFETKYGATVDPAEL
jgi:RNA polymerase sigma-32 factor